MKQPLIFLLLLIALAVSPVLSRAASDGDTGTTSTGSLDVSLAIGNLVRISGIEDLSFGSYDGNGDEARDDDVCIWTNQNSATYRVKARGSGAAHSFLLSDGASQTLAYTVRWNDTTGTDGNESLAADTLSGVMTNANTSSTTCSGGSNANFQVKIAEAALLARRPGTFSGVLTLIISPHP